MQQADLYKYCYFPDDKDFLDDFLSAKKDYIKDRSKQNIIKLMDSYDIVYHNYKHAMHHKQFSEDTFREIVKTLKEGIDND